MGKVDDVDTPNSNTVSTERRDSYRRGRYSSLRDDDEFYRPYRPYDDRYASRYGYGSILSEVETETSPNVKPVQEEHWFASHWRPSMAWLYFAICAFDFILAPVFTFWFSYFTKIPYVPWEPLTLRGGGLIHVSLGAIIGVYTWSRTREKLANVAEDTVYRRY